VATVRDKIVQWAKWGVANTAQIHYAEKRPMPLTSKLPLTTDCSGFVTLCYWLAGAPDPNGLGYDGQGYTGTLLSHGQHILLAQVQPGDVIVYGPGTGVHTAIVIEAGKDPLTVSHGEESEPAFVRVSQDGREPQTYLRFPTTKAAAVKHVPNGPVAPVAAPKPKPAPEPAPAVVTVTGPKGGLIARRPLKAVGALVVPLLRRFRSISLRRGS
jgi:NlpC/P60 family